MIVFVIGGMDSGFIPRWDHKLLSISSRGINVDPNWRDVTNEITNIAININDFVVLFMIPQNDN